MMLSPSSASATRRARNCTVGMTITSDGILRDRVDQRRPAAELRKLTHEAAGAVRDDQRAMSGLLLKDVHVPIEDDHQSAADIWPTLASASPAANVRCSPKRRTRSISSGASTGNI